MTTRTKTMMKTMKTMTMRINMPVSVSTVLDQQYQHEELQERLQQDRF
jgi:hypothetical protein